MLYFDSFELVEHEGKTYFMSKNGKCFITEHIKSLIGYDEGGDFIADNVTKLKGTDVYVSNNIFTSFGYHNDIESLLYSYFNYMESVSYEYLPIGYIEIKVAYGYKKIGPDGKFIGRDSKHKNVLGIVTWNGDIYIETSSNYNNPYWKRFEKLIIDNEFIIYNFSPEQNRRFVDLIFGSLKTLFKRDEDGYYKLKKEEDKYIFKATHAETNEEFILTNDENNKYYSPLVDFIVEKITEEAIKEKERIKKRYENRVKKCSKQIKIITTELDKLLGDNEERKLYARERRRFFEKTHEAVEFLCKSVYDKTDYHKINCPSNPYNEDGTQYDYELLNMIFDNYNIKNQFIKLAKKGKTVTIKKI